MPAFVRHISFKSSTKVELSYKVKKGPRKEALISVYPCVFP